MWVSFQKNGNKRKYLNVFFYAFSLGYISYQIKSTLDVLNNTLDTKTIDHFENKSRCVNLNNYITIQQKPEKSSSLYDRFWDALTFSYARRLLNLAQNENPEIRLRAIRSLAAIHSLDDWHYSLLAHMCDARTAIGLARSKDVDLRYFVCAPNPFVQSHVGLAKWVQDFMISLNKTCEHQCLEYFITKKFQNLQDLGHLVEHDITSNEVAQCLLCKNELLPAAVDSLLHHSTIGHHAKDIVKTDGLPLLMEIYKKYKDDTDIVMSLVKIISNISTYPELLQDVFKSGICNCFLQLFLPPHLIYFCLGWVGVLADLLKSDDIRISGPAAKTLANLDMDDHLDGKYERKVYLLHPTMRSIGKCDVDVILVHGLLGGVFFTWRQRDRIIEPAFGFKDFKRTRKDKKYGK